MKLIVINEVETQPENVEGFPEYILCCLLKQGPALIEADGATTDGESVEWRFSRRRKSDDPPLVVRIPKAGFRSALARFGFLCGISPYGGHTLFHIRLSNAQKATPERFAIYLCNEPTMGFWVRIYLYAIDRDYPNYGGMLDKTPNVAPSDIP